jgi:PAS domain S-box-containing protein
MHTAARDLPSALTLFEHLADAVYLLDPESSHIVWANRAAWESLGLTPEAVLDHSVLSLQKDVTGAPQWSDIAAVIRSVPCFTFVGRHRHAAGHEVAVEVNTTRFTDQGREYFLSVARDVSRRVALEAELKSREGQLWYALNEALDGLWDWDIAGGGVFFSPQLKRMLGYGPDEMAPVVETWSGSIHPEDAARVRQAMNQHLDGRRARYEAEYRLRTRNGGWLWVLDRGRVCERDAQGRAVRIVGMVQDVTQEHVAREALQRSEQMQRALIAALPDAIVRLDREGRHLFISERAAALTALPVAAAIGRTPEELGLPPAICRYWARTIDEVVRSGQAQESEFEIDTPQGRRTIGCRAVPEPDAQGRVHSVLAVCRDITERRRIQRELDRHREQLEALVAERTAALTDALAAADAANRAKSRFLANMSHELRTPLGAIIGMTTLARERARDPVLAGQLDKVAQASQHLLTLISDILDLSRIEAERMALDEAEFRLDALVDEVLQIGGHRAQDKGLALTAEVDPALAGAALRGDPLRLRQVLLNLVDNAIKFTARGFVRLRVQERASGLLRFEVVDDGIGIAPENRERLFRPFEQADDTTTRRYGGTGLGLAIARELVHLMGGEIGVDSQPGRGSCFWFTARLPGARAVPAPAAAGQAVAQAREALRRAHAGRHVLVVDDDEVSREVGGELLRQAGLRVSVAVDGDEAVALAAGEPYALVLMDMQMPRLDGLQATARLRAAGANRRTPVVALTANAFDDDRLRCLDAGMDDFLTKPVDAARLYATVARLLGAAAPPALPPASGAPA